MTNITFFFLLIPFLALALLGVNFLFASHTPYQEKNSTFECGFHSFLGQNRMQFNISFYIFGLLFLLFDLEILLIYPYPVSAQFNSLYGLAIMLIFFIILTLGFTFEFGKNALKIDSRQYDIKSIIYMFNINNNNNDNNKLLSSGLFNINSSNLKDKLKTRVLPSIIVLIFFTFIYKIFIFSFEGLITSILSSIIIVIAIFLKKIMRASLSKDIKEINEIMDNKLGTLLLITSFVIILSFITYSIMFVFASSNSSLELKYMFYATSVLDDVIDPSWTSIIQRVENVLRDPNSRLRIILSHSKEYDKALSNIKEIHLSAWFNGYANTPRGREYIADCKESQDLMQWVLNEHFSQFSKLRGDLRKSADNVRLKFESLPDNHPGKHQCLDIINRQLNQIRSLANDFDNKKINPKK